VLFELVSGASPLETIHVEERLRPDLIAFDRLSKPGASSMQDQPCAVANAASACARDQDEQRAATLT
jgi:hypothetical protein